MKVTLVDTVGTSHPVYASVEMVVSQAAQELGWERVPAPSAAFSLNTPTNVLAYTRLDFGKGRIHLLKAPMVNLECFEALLRGAPAILVEEHFPRGNFKDAPARFILGLFKRYPFISQTKKTHAFLGSLGIKSFLVPPAEKRRRGSSSRKHILYVGKALPTKNPLLFLKLASLFPRERFVMVCRGPDSTKLSERARALANLKIVPGLKSREELFRLYADAKLLVHPALRDPIAHVIVEALGTQTPVLASSRAGASSFLPAEWVADPLREGEWVEKAKAILASQEESVKKAGRIFREEHLDISDPYFGKVAKELSNEAAKRWPSLK